jgi:hypothetical protein
VNVLEELDRRIELGDEQASTGQLFQELAIISKVTL